MKILGYNAELITEYAKDLGYGGQMPTMQHHQTTIFAEQNRRQAVLRGQVDWAITDSPTILGLVYGKETDCVTVKFYEYALEVFHSYEQYNFFIERDHSFQTEGRYHDEEHSKRIDADIKTMLDTHNISYSSVRAGPNTISQILESLSIV